MNLEELKKGDKLEYVQFAGNFYNAKVIENFPEKEIIFINIKIGWLMNIKDVSHYSSNRFTVAKKKEK